MDNNQFQHGLDFNKDGPHQTSLMLNYSWLHLIFNLMIKHQGWESKSTLNLARGNRAADMNISVGTRGPGGPWLLNPLSTSTDKQTYFASANKFRQIISEAEHQLMLKSITTPLVITKLIRGVAKFCSAHSAHAPITYDGPLTYNYYYIIVLMP